MMSARRLRHTLVILLTALVCAPALSSAQYFGRNKVQYRTFAFQVLQSEHFDLYYYPEEQDAAQLAARIAERWYARLSRFFGHELRGRQVLILYAAPSHFRQTNAVEGLIGEGTGGVTEALKRRIVVPMSGSLADTNHVIGHELVHAFQFDMTGSDPRDGDTGGPGILQYPLWFVEGMAEYLSLGPVDAQTAMWMRDAALREKLPSIRDLEKPEYFPYRWGHSFWAFIGSKYSDRAVASLVRSAANPRFDLIGLARQLGTDPDTLTAEWHQAITTATENALDERPPIASEPRRVISRTSGAGRYNIGPRLSPDGTRIAFFSERDRFSIDLYLADAETGRIERKLVGSATDPHFDSLQFLNSAGAWTPDGRSLGLTAIRGGKCVLVIVDAKNGRDEREIELPGLDDAINPSFSPDGRSVVLSGSHGGFVDLFLLDLGSGKLAELTNDEFADLEPSFTPDGKTVVFVTERFSTDFSSLAPGPLRLARLTLATRDVSPIAGFLQGKQISPVVSADGKTLTFIAEPDGISNLYRMSIDGGAIGQISSFATGVAGITTSSPALSGSSTDRLAFSVFEDGGHSIYVLDPTKVVTTVAKEATGNGASLTGRNESKGDVERMLADSARGLPPSGTQAPSTPYTRTLTLDFLSQPTISASVGQFGTFFRGGMSALFSDMLGDRVLAVSGAVSGDLADFGGTIAYMNRRHRWNWAVAAESTPNRLDLLSGQQSGNTIQLTDLLQRQTVSGVSGLAALPLNTAQRLEFSAGAHSLRFTRQLSTATYVGSSIDNLQLVDTSTHALPAGDTLYLADTNAAFVSDTAIYGAISPILGRRYRVQFGYTGGSLRYTTALADFRQYFMPVRPLTVALRVVHIGRYGGDAESPQLVSFYAGYPELVHGYPQGSLDLNDCRFVVGAVQCPTAETLSGTKMLVANAEVHAPLVGLFRGTLDYGALPIELAAFLDSGVTWTSATRPGFLGGNRDMLRSAGGAARINAFSLLLIEIAASHPFDGINHGWRWQVGLRGGF